jgi:hypothetical protein
MANILTIAITDPGLDKKSAEAQYIQRALHLVENEVRRGNGTVTSGTIIGYTTGLGPTAMGTWTYTPTATTP